MAYSLALLVNFLGLVLSFWLGVYIVTRSRKSRIAWSAGLTLWALAGFFANVLLLIDSGPAPAAQPMWLRLIFPIWPQQSGGSIAGWTQGWAASLAIFCWYHTSLFILPGKLTRWQRLSLLLIYALGLFALLVQIFQPDLFRTVRSDPLLVDTQSIYSIFPLFAAALVAYSGLSLLNFLEAKRRSASLITGKQLNMLINASLIACLATVLSISGTVPGISIPVVWISGLAVAAVFFFGFGVIRYSALLDQRILRRDIIYSGVATGLVVVLYLSVIIWLIAAYNLPNSIIVILVPLAILSHSLMEEIRHVVERIVYDRRTRVLRSSLRSLSKLTVEQADLSALLSRSLETICYPVLATYAVILVFDGESARPTGAYRWNAGPVQLLRKDFEADDVQHLSPGSLPEPFIETTLLVPLYASLVQIGVLLLGRPENGIHYTSEDVLLLQSPIDQVTDLIVKYRVINEYLDQIVQLPLKEKAPPTDLIPATWVEDALQNYCDFAYLGDSPLANLNQVRVLLNGTSITHLDLGKAVCQVITTAVEKLRPRSTYPSGQIPREWYPYLILHDAYFDGLPNRDIISKLYISEGTFHRTRRSAIRSVTRVLSELETAIN